MGKIEMFVLNILFVEGYLVFVKNIYSRLTS